MFLFVIFGVELFVGLYSLKFCLFRLVEGNIFIELVIIVYLLDRMLLNRLEYSRMLNCDGFLISCMVVLLMYICVSLIFGYFVVILLMIFCYKIEDCSMLVLLIDVILWWCLWVDLNVMWVICLVLKWWYILVLKVFLYCLLFLWFFGWLK